MKKRSIKGFFKLLWKSIINWVKGNVALTSTIFFAVVSLVFWLLSVDIIDFSDLWLNLLAGFIASICTITVIDNTMKKQKEKEDKPFQLAMYREVQIFTSRFIYLWRDMYVQSNVGTGEVKLEDFFSPKYINLIYDNLDLEGEPIVLPKQNWYMYLDREIQDLISRGNTILNRYSVNVEPELFQAIYHLINDSNFIGRFNYIKVVLQGDRALNIPRCSLLSYYTSVPTDEDYKAIEHLFKWCKNNYEKLHDFGIIYKIPDYMKIDNSNNAPKSRMSEQKKFLQQSNMIKWRNEQNNTD